MGTYPTTMRGSAAMADVRNGVESAYGTSRGPMLGRVLGINWAKRTLKCVGMHMDEGSGPWIDVPIASSVFTQSEASHWIPSVAPPVDTSFSGLSALDGVDDAIAIIVFANNNPIFPICVGFLPPLYHEFSFDEPGTKIDRHASDVYSRMTSNGTYEFAFPDGTYFKVAPITENIGLTDLSSGNVHESRPWTIVKDDPRFVTMMHSSGASVVIDPFGNMSVSTPTNLNVNAVGSTTIQSTGSLTINTSSTISINSSGGNITVNGVNLVTHNHVVSVNGSNQSTSGPQ